MNIDSLVTTIDEIEDLLRPIAHVTSHYRTLLISIHEHILRVTPLKEGGFILEMIFEGTVITTATVKSLRIVSVGEGILFLEDGEALASMIII